MTCGSIASGLTYKLETQGMGRYKRCLEGKKKDIWRNNELNFYKFDENWKYTDSRSSLNSKQDTQ